MSPVEILEVINQETYFNVLYFSRLMFYINSAINPILYNIMSSKFRDGFKRVFFRCLASKGGPGGGRGRRRGRRGYGGGCGPGGHSGSTRGTRANTATWTDASSPSGANRTATLSSSFLERMNSSIVIKRNR